MEGTAAAKLPSKVTLPSRAVAHLRRAGAEALPPLARAPAAPLFSEVEQAIATGRVAIEVGGKAVDVGALSLRDFHVLRALLARSGVIEEPKIEISCLNCAAVMRVRPCAALEIGPWVDGELDDPELDRTAPAGEPIPVLEIPLGRVRSARTVTFEERTVEQARALFAAAAATHLDMTADVVRSMGIVALGAERDARKIADALADCDDPAFFAVTDAFLATHYTPRLGSVVFCSECGARNDIDAPYEREFGAGEGAREDTTQSGVDAGFVSFEAFAKRASEIAPPLVGEIPGQEVELVVEGGTAAVDDGGEPLLGSYVPPHPGDAGTPTQAPTVTVYFRTFRAMWDEEGPYDWEDELAETIEHELEHHVAFLRGADAVDDDERAAIRDEAVRVVGRREVGRRAARDFGQSWSDFLRRTWPLWLLAVLALLVMLATQRE